MKANPKRQQRRNGLLFLCLFVTPWAVAESEWTVSAEQWSRPRSGDMVRELPGVSAAVRAWEADDSATLVLFYPGGESGSLWAEELRSWLIALGVPGDSVSTRPGSPDAAQLIIRIED